MKQVLHSFYVVVLERPPSVNKLYVNGRGGRRILSKEGVAFKSRVVGAIVEECMKQSWKAAIEAVYLQRAWVHVSIGLHQEIYNKSWKPGQRTPSGALQSPYKQEDAPNYFKIIEDAIKEGTGIDDSAHCHSEIKKLPDENYRFIEIAYEVCTGEVS